MALLFFSTFRHFQRLPKLLLTTIWRSSSAVTASEKNNKVLPFSSIPGPKGTIRNILGYALGKGSHFEIVLKRFEKFGPIYKEQLLDMRIVNIANAEAVEKVFPTDQKFQMRPGLEAVNKIIDEISEGGENFTFQKP